MGSLDNVGFSGEHFGDARGRGRGLRPVREQFGARDHRRDEQGDVLEEGEEVTGRHAAGRAEPTAEPDDDEHRVARTGEQGRVERGPCPSECDTCSFDRRRPARPDLGELRFEAVALDHANPLHLLFHELRPHAELLLQRDRRGIQPRAPARARTRCRSRQPPRPRRRASVARKRAPRRRAGTSRQTGCSRAAATVRARARRRP